MFRSLAIAVLFTLLLVQLPPRTEAGLDAGPELEQCRAIKMRMRAQGIRVFRSRELGDGCPLECLQDSVNATRYYCCGPFFAAEVIDLSTGRMVIRCLPRVLTSQPFFPTPGVPVTARPLPPFCSNAQSANPDDFSLESYSVATRNASLVEEQRCRFILTRGGFPLGERRVTVYDCIDGYMRVQQGGPDDGYSCVEEEEEESTLVTDIVDELATPADRDVCPFDVINDLDSFRRRAYSLDAQRVFNRILCFFEERRNGILFRVTNHVYFDCPEDMSRVEDADTGLYNCETLDTST